MVKYSDMVGWMKCYELILNRIDIINQLLGYGVTGRMDNPCRIRWKSGRYRITLFDTIVNELAPYDYPTAQMVSERMDAMSQALWHVGRNGMLLQRANLLV